MPDLVRFLLITLIASLSACAAMPAKEAPPPVEAEVVALTPAPGLSPKERLRRALELLGGGDEEQARVEILAYLERIPNSQVAANLLLQIDTASDVYYPAEYQEVILKPGQSLSNVAKVYLGNAYEFFGLAKYNDIVHPGRVVPGQVIRVPLTPEALDAFEQEIVKGDAPEVDSETAVEALADDMSVEEELEDAEKLEEIQASTASPMAPQLAGQQEARLEEVSAPAVAPQQLDAIHRQAINAYRAQDLDAAIELWDQILTLDPTYESARLYRSQAQALKKRLQSLQ